MTIDTDKGREELHSSLQIVAVVLQESHYIYVNRNRNLSIYL